MEESLQATATILSLVNPTMCAGMFMRGRAHESANAKSVAAVQAVLAIGFILVFAAFAGTAVLDLFGVSLDAFAVAGGGILIWIGIGMMSEAQRGGSGSAAHDEASLAPVVIFAASPGTITGVITIGASHSDGSLPTSALVAIGVTCTVLLLVLLGAARWGGDKAQPTVSRQVITSYLGLIVIAMGVQFALSALRSFFQV